MCIGDILKLQNQIRELDKENKDLQKQVIDLAASLDNEEIVSHICQNRLEELEEAIKKQKNKKPLVINLFGGPGTGKSTMRARIFTELKYKQLCCEEITEFAKDKTWEENWPALNNQIFMFGSQFHRMYRVMGKVDILITDSPILLCAIYDKLGNKNLERLVVEQHKEMNTLNVFLERKHKYQSFGRNEDEDAAKEVDQKIISMLEDNKIEYIKSYSSSDNAIMIANLVENLVK